MKQCRTVVDLIEAFPLLYNRDRGIMICEECVEVEGDDSKEVKVKSGLFVYEDDQFEGQRILTAAFRNMKKHITSHLLSSNHKISENVEKRRRKKTQQLKLKEKLECALLGFDTNATNGPILVEAEKILMSAMKSYW